MKKRYRYLIILFSILLLAGCSKNVKKTDGSLNYQKENSSSETGIPGAAEQNKGISDHGQDSKNTESTGQSPDTAEITASSDNKGAFEYKYNHELQLIDDNYRTYYEVFLYSFYDSNGDGIGDINGLIQKLDYINDGNPETDTDLGFTGIWLMPVMPSDSYHKYDVKDYYSIDPQYGTIEDFKNLIKECDKRGIKVIIDLVLNHTSSMNPWFLSAVKSLDIKPCGKDVCTEQDLCREHNPYVGYYNFVKGKHSQGEYYGTGCGDWYYEGVFTPEMPDLNLADAGLRKEIENIIDYWLDLGVGGFRLDAALHYYTGDNDKNIEVLSWLNNYVKSKNEQNYLVAEVWTNFSTYAQYYKSGLDSMFNFAFAKEDGKIVKTLNDKGSASSARAFGEAMLAVQNGLKKYSNHAIDAPFFTNHDTARASGFFSNTDKIKTAGGMNLMMSGNVFVYYGEELGMSGTGRDENKRAPMYWSAQGAAGMTIGPADMETVTHKYGSADEQMKDPLSIYNYFKRAIRLRNENPEIARGEMTLMTDITDPELCAVTRTFKGSTLMMLYNISAKEKQVTVSKSAYGYNDIRGYLSVNAEAVTLNGETLTMPPYSIVILK